ncbi:MAG: Tm-1-like ATP-binding domain-containing protein [Anaerolineales bacterium]|nr:Tm-1-like ATP-binding domain-containing protein [Anaerolineales bacterium]
MSKHIAIIGTLDTKGPEVEYVRALIAGRGHIPLVIDTGIRGLPVIESAISRQELAAAAGTTLDDILARGDKNAAINTMASGVATVVRRLYEQGKLDGVLALGGVQGTVIGTAAMRALPVGVPKVMLSTVANGQATFGPFVGTRDVTIIHSVADILGLNSLTRQVLAEAAGAVVGMVEMVEMVDAARHSPGAGRPTIGMTVAGVTTPCAMRVRELLERAGYEVISFHCNGIGAQAMEELAAEGRLQGIVDLSPHDIPGYLFNGLMRASPDRMLSSTRKGIPIVFVPGGADFLLFGPLETVPPAMLTRKYVQHNPIHTHVKASHEEMKTVGRFVGERLSQTTGQAVVMLPRGGYSQLNIVGGPLYEPESDAGFVKGLTETLFVHLKGYVAVIEMDVHINDPLFAESVAAKLRELVEGRQEQPTG